MQRAPDIELYFYGWQFVWFLFLIFPICSIAVLDALHFKHIGHGSWLASDLRVVCPLFNEGAFLFSWTIISAIGYPFGIPLNMLLILSLRHFGIQKMARLVSYLSPPGLASIYILDNSFVTERRRKERH